MIEIAIRAGSDTLDELVTHTQEALDVETLDRLRHERDMMLFTAAVLADIAALPSTEASDETDHGYGMYL